MPQALQRGHRIKARALPHARAKALWDLITVGAHLVRTVEATDRK